MSKYNKKYLNDISIKCVFDEVCKKYSENILLSHPSKKSNQKSKYYTFREVKELVNINSLSFKEIGLNIGDRVSVMIGNIPEFFIIKLALNYNGISCVPINNESSISEVNYLLSHSESKLIIVDEKLIEKLKKIKVVKKKEISLALYKKNRIKYLFLKGYRKKNVYKKVTVDTESSLLYTSGSTGKPKACIITHEYEVNAGINYINKKSLISMKNGHERIYNCLPVHHVNAGILSFYAALLSGNCQIQGERFSAKNFWKEIIYSKATIFHYLGVMATILLKQKKSILEEKNKIKFAAGAGIEPNLHKVFEQRFKFPMIELWGMTEMVRCIFDYKKDREIGSRCIGSPKDILEAKVINKDGKRVFNTPGELLIRYSYKKPRRGFFKGYFKDNKATKKIWEGNWFHTGDLVLQKRNTKIYFVDRKKNIIRRAGENISATEVESVLLEDNRIQNCAVISFPHEIYEEEVMSFIVLKKNICPSIMRAKSILKKVSLKLSYFKVPGIVQFCKDLPTTSTQKIEKVKLNQRLKNENKKLFYNLCDYKKTLRTKN